MIWAACKIWGRSNTRRTSPCFTRRGSHGFSQCLLPRVRGAGGTWMPSVTPERFCPRPMICWSGGDCLARRRWRPACPRRVPGARKATPPLTADQIPATLPNRIHAHRDVRVSPRFEVGQRVRARNINPTGHTRLPRYARGKIGTVYLDHGVYVFPDTNAHFLGEKPQQVYSVRFAARELWGEQAAPQDSVYVDMWDDYLEPA